MGITKIEGFNDDILLLTNKLKAIAHPSRLSIVLFLIDKKQCIGNDILEELPIAQPTLSRHLKELKDSGWINAKVVGNTMLYCLNPDTLNLLNNYFNSLKSKANSVCC